MCNSKLFVCVVRVGSVIKFSSSCEGVGEGPRKYKEQMSAKTLEKKILSELELIYTRILIMNGAETSGE